MKPNTDNEEQYVDYCIRIIWKRINNRLVSVRFTLALYMKVGEPAEFANRVQFLPL